MVQVCVQQRDRRWRRRADALIESLRREFGVIWRCHQLELKPTSYWAWRRRRNEEQERENAQLKEKIKAFHAQSGGTYGCRRMTAKLRQAGIEIGRDRVYRWMRPMGLSGRFVRNYRGRTRSDHRPHGIADHLLRQFTATEPGLGLGGRCH